MTTAAQVISIARAEVGYKEQPPTSNHTKYGAWYGLDGHPWCAMFCSWVFDRAGKRLVIQTSRGFGTCAVAHKWAKANGLWDADGRYVPGDLLLFDWNGGGGADHVGIVVSDNGNVIRTIEGNTGNTSQNNGGEVMEKARPHGGVILGAVRTSALLSATPPPLPRPPWQSDNGSVGHPLLSHGMMNSPAVKHMQSLLIRAGINVVADGDFGPNTVRALENWQRTHGFDPDGLCGPLSWAGLHR